MFNRLTQSLPFHMLRLRFDEGAAEGGGTATGTATPADAAAQTAAAQAATGTTSTAATSVPEKVEDLPAWAQKLITDTRSEAAQHRTAAKTAATQAQQELTDKLAVALGIKPDAATDPAALTALAEKAQADARTASIKLAVYQAAGAHQGNPDALLDSNTFLAKVNSLDPTAADFSTQVSEAIKAAVAANSSLKAARAAGASTVDTAGGPGETGQITEAQLAQMSPEEIVDAQKKGLLKNLLG